MTSKIDYYEYIYQKLKEKIDTAISRKEVKDDPDLLFPEEYLKEIDRKIYLKRLLDQFCGNVWQRAMQDLSVKNCEDLDKDDGSKTKGIDLLIIEQDGTKYAVQFAKACNTKNANGKDAICHLKKYSVNNNCKPVYATFGKTSRGLDWDKLEWDKKNQIYKTYGRGNGELFGVDYDKIIDATKNAISRIIKEREEWLKG